MAGDSCGQGSLGDIQGLLQDTVRNRDFSVCAGNTHRQLVREEVGQAEGDEAGND